MFKHGNGSLSKMKLKSTYSGGIPWWMSLIWVYNDSVPQLEICFANFLSKGVHCPSHLQHTNMITSIYRNVTEKKINSNELNDMQEKHPQSCYKILLTHW